MLRLKRHQTLRKVVVAAIRRQNLTPQVTDAPSAMRKWKQLVRRCRENDRLSQELAGLAEMSPLTPVVARQRASAGRRVSDAMSGGRSSGGWGGGGVRGYGEGRGDATPSFSRSPFPASAVERSSARRRLWDETSPKVSPVEEVADSS